MTDVTHMVEMAIAGIGESECPKVIKWWFNLDYSKGATNRTLTLDKARLWDCIASVYELDTSEHLDSHLK